MRAVEMGVLDRHVPQRAERMLDLGWLLFLALALRLLTYNGLFGSDDGTYIDRAIDVATGAWSPADYNGALRYGFNIPAGLFVWLLGPSPFVVNLWPLLCSLIEVALVYVMAASIAGRSAGVFAGLMLAAAPLHIAVATRIHADAVVSMFITLSYVLLWFGWRHANQRLLFSCGLALGGIFWAKELVAITWLAFLPLLWFFRGRWHDTVPVFLGLALMLLGHGALMWLLNGHPLHLITTVLSAVNRQFIGAMSGEDAPAYYFRYLFFDIRHTGLLGFLAVSGLFWWVMRKRPPTSNSLGLMFAVVWLVGLIAVLSFFPVSLSPLRFVMKQSNYITLFLAPLAIFAGIALASMRVRWAVLAAGSTVAVGVTLGLLQQADYRAFTANSKALSQKLVADPGAVFVGTTHNFRLGASWARLESPGRAVKEVVPFVDIQRDPTKLQLSPETQSRVFVAFDRHTARWVAGTSPIESPLPCWGAPIERLQPADLGLGNRVAGALAHVAATISSSGVPGARSAQLALLDLASPKPADLYLVDDGNVLCTPP